MTRQAIIAEQARRMISRVSGAADEIGVKPDVRFNITALRQHKAIARATSFTTGDAIRFVNVQTDGAERRDDVLSFEIVPFFPTFVVTVTGDVETL